MPTDTLTETQPEEVTEELNEGFDTFVAKTEQFARAEPMRAVGYSFLVGLVLNVLPIGALLTGVLRLGLALIKPALVVLGAVKLYEELSTRAK